MSASISLSHKQTALDKAHNALEGLKMLISLVALALNVSFPVLANSHSPIIFDARVTNSPGLTCRPIFLAMVYGGPNLASRVLGRTQNYIAITGPQVNGFLPVLTGSGVKGWVRENETWEPDGISDRPCRVQIQPNGHLIFE